MESRNITKIVRNMFLFKNSQNKTFTNLSENEFEMLRYVSKRDFRYAYEIADYLNVDKGLVTRMSKKLEKLGYIKIENDISDMRKKIIKPTAKAYEIKNDVVDSEILFYNNCLSVLSDTEKEEFLKLVDKVYIKSKELRKNGFKDIK